MRVKRLTNRKTAKAGLPAKQIPVELSPLFRLLLTLSILTVYGYFLAFPIDVTNGDIGRHLKNGELFFQHYLIPNTNLFSYTFPDRPFINHHWGSGVIFYAVERIAGFYGLSLVFIAISLLTLFLFLDLAAKHASFALAAPIALCIIPLLITRRVIRPELFSYLLSAFFLRLLWNHRSDSLGFRRLLFLPILMVLWVNLHIYFFIGLILIGVSLIELLTKRFVRRASNTDLALKELGIVMLLSVAATCLNPAGIRGAIYPFVILQEYEFPVMENFSVTTLVGAGFDFPAWTYFLIVFGLLSFSWLYAFISDRSSMTVGNCVLSVIFSALAWRAVRNFSMFAYFALPLIGVNLRYLRLADTLKRSTAPKRNFIIAIVLISTVLVSINPRYFFSAARGPIGVGLKEANDAAAEFFRKENLQGPIFNNFDVGGYLIYHLYPKQKVFVDNRPEAYPAAFFSDVYFPLLRNEEDWSKISNDIGFNVIVFNHRDRSTLSEQFVVRRVLDPLWAPVFLDKDIIMLVKRYGPNRSTVSEFELAKERVLTRSN